MKNPWKRAYFMKRRKVLGLSMNDIQTGLLERAFGQTRKTWRTVPSLSTLYVLLEQPGNGPKPKHRPWMTESLAQVLECKVGDLWQS